MTLKFVFAGSRSASVSVRDKDEGVRVALQAKTNGVTFSDYGIPCVYFDFYMDLSGWTQGDADYLYAALGCVKAKQ